MKRFYKFVNLNRHLSLHDVAEIFIKDKNLSICYSFEEWNAMERRIKSGHKGILYYDIDGNKKFVFNENSTYGETKYLKIYPSTSNLISSLDILNSNLEINYYLSDYRKIYKNVKNFFQTNHLLYNHFLKDELIVEGVSYSLYIKSKIKDDEVIYLHPFPFSLKENANLFKEIYELTQKLENELEKIKQNELIKTISTEKQEEPTEKKKKTNKKGNKKAITIFDFSTEEKSNIEKLIEWGIKQGSGFVNGKLRIYNEYQKNLIQSDFIKFIKNEYGIGGKYGSIYQLNSDAKGLFLENHDINHKEDNVSVFLNWKEVAEKISLMIDLDNYLTEEEKEKFPVYLFEENNSEDSKKLKEIVNDLVEEGIKKTTTLSWYTPFSQFQNDITIIKDNIHVFEYYLNEKNEIASAEILDDGIDLVFYSQYVPYYIDNLEINEEKDDSNIDDISNELGGAKQRYKNNIDAIKLSNLLYQENRNPTLDERKILSKYIGWGGIPYPFDETNSKWHKEHFELKNLLSAEDYERAKGSILNAYFTPKEIINAIYSALARFGVRNNNKILETSLGTGNFFGYMPDSIRNGSKLYGVELDNVTGKIAKKLYPDAQILIKSFEDTNFLDNSFDLVVGNVPFGGYQVYDTDYNKYNFLIHDYFIAKSIDKVRSGGIVAIVTSKGTMDKLNPSAREYIASRAKLLGAIRLPNSAFKKYANTSVVADILFFQKREEIIYPSNDECDWLSTAKVFDDFNINQYFLLHKDMILGTLDKEIGLYGANSLTVKENDVSLEESLKKAIENLPSDIYNPLPIINDELKIDVDYSVKEFCYTEIDGKIYMRIREKMEEVSIPKSPSDAKERIINMIALRNEIRHLLNLQINGCNDEELNDEQKKLNEMYDNFIKKFGFINNKVNYKLFKDDGDSALLFASEVLSSDKTIAYKSDIFSKRTIRPYSVITKTDDVFTALQISKNERGCVDIFYIATLTEKNCDEVIHELDSAIYRDPDKINLNDKYSGFVTSDEYLSGNIKSKLIKAKAFSKIYPNENYERNIKALESVLPTPIKASEISVRLGASWIDLSYYKDFLVEILNIPYYFKDDLNIFYNKHDSSYRVDFNRSFLRNYHSEKINSLSTSRASAFRLFEDALNLKSTTIYDLVKVDDKDKRVLNQVETLYAREKQNQIKELFKDWIFKDPARRDVLEEEYNNIFNQIRLPLYDGSYLQFPEMNPAIELKKHQKDAVHRIITSGNTLLHHVVGAGKTYTICATIMKLRQYGLAKKPLIVVPNHLVGQWASEFRYLYPNAKLLVTTKNDLDKDNRQKFVSRVALGDFDAIIMAQSSFSKIPISTERQINKIKSEIVKIEATIMNKDKDHNLSHGALKNLERIKKSKETTLKKLLDADNKDNVLIFENLGVDYLFVDEAHFYKNLFLYTKMNNVSGISQAASSRASDLQLKCEYINEIHNADKGVVFATGTPISNSMTEMYTMQTYLQPRTLNELGLTFFDLWAADFGETITSLEISPSGEGYKAKTRFAKFTNLPELLTLYRSFADVKTSEMVKLNVPKATRNVVNLKPSDITVNLAYEIANRAEEISNGGVDPHIDNMLKVTSDGKKLALDVRCFDPSLKDEVGSKINECSFRIYEIYKRTNDFRGTQIVFCDMSTPKCNFSDYVVGQSFDVYNDLKYKLVSLGIKKEEIAYIHEANSDMQKQELFSKVNDGIVRVLIGSTEKCGAGTNVQTRLVALHHLDTPYRPSDLEQREGRIIRQGNMNEEVEIYTYVTERTFDSYSYQILENKQRFISQIDRGDLVIREAMDIDETTLTYAEIKAITAANPKIKRKMELDTEVAKLKVLEGQYKKNLYALQDKVRRDLPEAIKKQELYLERLKKDILLLDKNFHSDNEKFLINVKGINYTDKKDGTIALNDALIQANDNEVVAIYNGFKISLDPVALLTMERSITLNANGIYHLDIGTSAIGNMTRIENFFKDFKLKEEYAIRRLEELNKDLIDAQKEIDVPFEYKEKLEMLEKELIQINQELDLNKKDEVIIEDEQYDKRSFLNNFDRKKEDIILNESQELKIDKTYQNSFHQKITDEFSSFMMEYKNKEALDIVKDSYKINFYKELYQYLTDENTDLEEIQFKALYNQKGKVLESLYDYYLKNEFTSINSYSEINDLIVSYNSRYNDEYMKQNESIEKRKNWITINVPRSALIESYEKHSFFKMPLTNEEYRGYTYNIFNNRIKDGRMITDLKSDSRELCYEIIMEENEEVILNKNNNTKKINAILFKEIVSSSNDKDYYIEKKEKEFVRIDLPIEAMIGKYENASLFKLPNYSMFKDEKYYIPNIFIKESKNGRIEINLPNTFEVELKDKEKSEIKKISPYELFEETSGASLVDFSYKESKTNKRWNTLSLINEARIKKYDEATLFKMPKGKYSFYSYYLPNGLINENDEKFLMVSLPDDFKITLRNQNKETITLSKEEYQNLVVGKSKEDYETELKKPSEKVMEKINQRIEILKKNVPEEMLNRQNWVVVRTKENLEKQRLEKYLIDPNNGSFAKSDDSSTWASFDDACEFLKAKGGVTLAYALDGKDGICAIDLDHSIDENGNYSDLLERVLKSSNNSYAEMSISKIGAHIFGKTIGMDLRSFSMDGDLEFYQKSHFIAMTGDLIGGKNKELNNFDNIDIKDILEKKCNKRVDYNGLKKGVEGLSLISDKEIINKAMNCKNGDVFKALYEGEDIRNNHSNSDMSLMNHLAFWCNGDKEQMIRIFTTSGLFRENKSPDYYESTAIKAIKDVTERYNDGKNKNIGFVKPTSNFKGA